MSHARILAAVLIIAIGANRASASPPGRGDSEEELLARLQQEKNPVKKAKYDIRLGRLKLLKAIEAYGKGEVEQGQQLLGAYLDRVRDSWETLRNSGRKAERQPQGFKELDIALREDTRLLEDLKHRVAFAEREPVENAALEADRIRGEVLRALFPGERPRGANDNVIPAYGPAFSIAMRGV